MASRPSGHPACPALPGDPARESGPQGRLQGGRPLIAFRTEGSASLGLGHVVRCLALATRLAPPARCAFVTRAQGCGPDKICGAGHQVIALPPDAGPEAAADAIAALSPDAVVADLPDADAGDYQPLRRRAPLLVVIDDLGLSACSADIVVNGTVVPEFRAYPERPQTQYLLGPEHMILREEFARCGAHEREFPDRARRAVVSMGGSDQLGLTPRVIEALDGVEAIERCLIIAGPMCGSESDVRRAAEQSRMTCRIVSDPPAIAPLLCGADLAVTCGGMTAYETAAVGTPMIALPQAPPQVIEIEHFVSEGAAAGVESGPPGRAGDPGLGRLAAVAGDLADNPQRRREMSRWARALVDGRGVHRVAQAILHRLMATARAW